MTPLARVVFVIVFGLLAGGTEPPCSAAPGAMRKSVRSSGVSATVACDGERLFVNFATAGAVVVSCLSRDGEILWQTKLCDYPIHQGYGASPIVHHFFGRDQLILIGCNQGETHVFRATPNGFESLATNKLGDEAFASPAICGGRIYLRTAGDVAGTRQERL